MILTSSYISFNDDNTFDSCSGGCEDTCYSYGGTYELNDDYVVFNYKYFVLNQNTTNLDKQIKTQYKLKIKDPQYLNETKYIPKMLFESFDLNKTTGIIDFTKSTAELVFDDYPFLFGSTANSISEKNDTYHLVLSDSPLIFNSDSSPKENNPFNLVLNNNTYPLCFIRK